MTTSPEIITVITAIIGGVFGSGFLQFIQFLIQRNDNKDTTVQDVEEIKSEIQDMNKSIQAMSDCVKGMAHNTIVHVCKKQIDQGYVTVDELDNVKGIYEPYKRMGGNGTGETYYEEMEKLPRKVTPKKTVKK